MYVYRSSTVVESKQGVVCLTILFLRSHLFTSPLCFALVFVFNWSLFSKNCHTDSVSIFVLPGSKNWIGFRCETLFAPVDGYPKSGRCSAC
jgi:hypothetical protein